MAYETCRMYITSALYIRPYAPMVNKTTGFWSRLLTPQATRHTPALATLTQLGYEMQRIATTENASPIAVR